MIEGEDAQADRRPTVAEFQLRRAQQAHPGVAPVAREREEKSASRLVTHAMPQNNWPMAEIRITDSAQLSDDARLEDCRARCPPRR